MNRRVTSAVAGVSGSDAPEGLLLVDKPAGWTSHDVVARVRRLAGIRRVGHAGTLDPMATGLLILGLGRATRLLGYLAGHDKDYAADIRLGVTTTTDDADGEVLATSVVPWTHQGVIAAMTALSGEGLQVPPAYSAIKVAGRRSYARARAGEEVVLAPRPVVVSRFALTGVEADTLSVDVTCSAGTYVRALARDLGLALGTGAHLCALRRTRIGRYGVTAAHALDTLVALVEQGGVLPVLGLAEAVAAGFPSRALDEAETAQVRHGRQLVASGAVGPVGAFDPDGALIALLEDERGLARPRVVFAPS